MSIVASLVSCIPCLFFLVDILILVEHILQQLLEEVRMAPWVSENIIILSLYLVDSLAGYRNPGCHFHTVLKAWPYCLLTADKSGAILIHVLCK